MEKPAEAGGSPLGGRLKFCEGDTRIGRAIFYNIVKLQPDRSLNCNNTYIETTQLDVSFKERISPDSPKGISSSEGLYNINSLKTEI